MVIIYIFAFDALILLVESGQEGHSSVETKCQYAGSRDLTETKAKLKATMLHNRA